MEKELLAAFEAAEKAAEAAAADGGLAEEDRCLDALKRLRRMPVTTKDLVNTQNIMLACQFFQWLASLAFLVHAILIKLLTCNNCSIILREVRDHIQRIEREMVWVEENNDAFMQGECFLMRCIDHCRLVMPGYSDEGIMHCAIHLEILFKGIEDGLSSKDPGFLNGSCSSRSFKDALSGHLRGECRSLHPQLDISNIVNPSSINVGVKPSVVSQGKWHGGDGGLIANTEVGIAGDVGLAVSNVGLIFVPKDGDVGIPIQVSNDMVSPPIIFVCDAERSLEPMVNEILSSAFPVSPSLIMEGAVEAYDPNNCLVNLVASPNSNVEVGKRIRSLTKHPKPRIQSVATDLFKFWKSVVIEETNRDSKKSSSSVDVNLAKTETQSERSDSTKVDKTSNSSSSKPNMRSKSESMKVEKFASERCLVSEKFSKIDSVKIEKTMKDESGSESFEKRNRVVETIKVEKFFKEEKQTSVSKKPLIPTGPPKLTSMVKCNDPMRDKLREQLAEAFSKVLAEASEDARDEVRIIVDDISACDPIRVAVTVESTMFEKLGRSNGTQKVKYRSIMFNLKDSNNTDLRRRVLLGHIMPEKLVSMTAEEMASDERKSSNKQIQEKALFECERGGPPKATTDQFRCGRCGQRKCTYYQLQTRSADEPMTTFVTCVNCNNHWKFC
ncbi:hypothetical protein M5K25_006547 [Dendrobium thyrsiflorum]|uniref:Uncharacterized protein n=1 Tax=Dendrobium thyrsiflorum TaxID=117978 RepID=A0ABD0VIP8_DENTH